LDDLGALAVVDQIRETDQVDHGAYGVRGLEQRSGLLRIVCQALTLFQMPGIARRVRLVEHRTPTVEGRVMNGVAVDGMRCRSAQALVLEGALAEVEHHEDTA